MMLARFYLKQTGVHCCRFFHTNIRVCGERNLVPERFLNLADTTGLTGRRKLEKDYHKRRYLHERVHFYSHLCNPS
jgi:hypothetical protein